MSNSSRKNARPLDDAEEKVRTLTIVMSGYTYIMSTQIADEEEVWETVRDTNEAQMQKTIESWKDELNNLLVFVRDSLTF